MKREVRKNDIIDYSSSEESKDDIETSTDEEIEYSYQDGKLQRSSGNTSFHVVNDSNSGLDPDTAPLSLSQTLSAKWIIQHGTSNLPWGQHICIQS